MQHPRIQSAKVIDDHALLVEFDNHEKRRYDVRPLLEKEMFFPLRNAVFFKNFQIENGGFAIVWNKEIDISEYELWSNGRPIP